MSRPAGLFVLLAAAACASAQVTLSTVQGGVAKPAPSVYDFKSVALGSVADVDFRLTNTGSSPVYLSELALVGTTSPTPPYTPYFSVVCALSRDWGGGPPLKQLPTLTKPPGPLDFRVQLEP